MSRSISTAHLIGERRAAAQRYGEDGRTNGREFDDLLAVKVRVDALVKGVPHLASIAALYGIFGMGETAAIDLAYHLACDRCA